MEVEQKISWKKNIVYDFQILQWNDLSKEEAI